MMSATPFRKEGGVLLRSRSKRSTVNLQNILKAHAKLQQLWPLTCSLWVEKKGHRSGPMPLAAGAWHHLR